MTCCAGDVFSSHSKARDWFWALISRRVFSSVFAPNTKKFHQVADPRSRVATDP